MNCNNCGAANFAGAEYCAKCGSDLRIQTNPSNPNPNQYSGYNPYSGGGGYNSQGQAPASNAGTFATLSLVFGILSVTIGAIAGIIPFPILALVFGNIAGNRGYAGGKARTGKILGIIGIVFVVISMIVWFVIGFMWGADFL